MKAGGGIAHQKGQLKRHINAYDKFHGQNQSLGQYGIP